MALDVINVPITAPVLQEYLAKLDERGEVYTFIVTSAPSRKLIGLALHRDGCEDALEVVLNLDGTWAAKHVIVVGEKN